MKGGRLRLRGRLSLAMAALVGGTVALTGWAALIRVEATYAARFDARVAGLLDAAALRLEGIRERTAGRLEDLSRALLEDRETTQRLLIRPEPDSVQVVEAAGRLHRLSGLDLLEILQPDGRILSSAQWLERVGFADESARQLPESGAVLRRERLPDGEILAMVARRTVSLGGRSILLVGGSELAPALLGELTPGPGEVVLLFDAGGGAPRTAGDAAALGPDAAGYPPALLRPEPGDERGRGTVRGADGRAWTAGSLPLRDAAGETIGALVAAVDTAQLTALRTRLRWTFGIVGGLGVLLAVIVGTWAAGRITEPVAELMRGVDAVTEGAADYSFPQPRADELGDLVQSVSRMRRALDLQQRRLLASERVAAWKEVAQRVAHEVKNPLSPIRLAVENLLKARKQAPEMFDPIFEEATQGILEEVDQLERIVSEFSAFARLPSPEPRPTDLPALVDDVLRLHAAEPALRVRRSHDGDLSAVCLDPDQFGRVLKNLVGNAVEAMGPGGGELEVATRRDGDTAVVEIADRGPGLAPEVEGRLFEPYFTTKPKGTGLGLPIALRIVADHGGSIRAENRSGGGTRVVIQLPVRPPGGTSA
jgi:signal transduction histidine kinase